MRLVLVVMMVVGCGPEPFGDTGEAQDASATPLPYDATPTPEPRRYGAACADDAACEGEDALECVPFDGPSAPGRCSKACATSVDCGLGVDGLCWSGWCVYPGDPRHGVETRCDLAHDWPCPAHLACLKATVPDVNSYCYLLCESLDDCPFGVVCTPPGAGLPAVCQ